LKSPASPVSQTRNAAFGSVGRRVTRPENEKDRTVWVEREIDAWIAALPNRQLKGDAS
jgi:hypothetical protein